MIGLVPNQTMIDLRIGRDPAGYGNDRSAGSAPMGRSPPWPPDAAPERMGRTRR